MLSSKHILKISIISSSILSFFGQKTFAANPKIAAKESSELATLINKSNFNETIFDYYLIQNAFKRQGHNISPDETFLIKAHYEDDYIDLSTLDDIIINIPIEEVQAAPPNLLAP